MLVSSSCYLEMKTSGIVGSTGKRSENQTILSIVSKLSPKMTLKIRIIEMKA